MNVKIFLLTSIGFIFLGLGVIGLFLPVWPTTPFILVSVACFSSTPQLKNRILKISFFKEYIENYESKTGLSKKTVWVSLSWLWGMLMLSVLIVQKLWITGLLVFIGVAVTTHILVLARNKKDLDE